MKKLLLAIILLAPAIVGAEARTFTITGYYSPLPDQDYFLTGSYESEIRLNGNGTHGADGTPVYPGMIAAPKTYAFGTKICLPGFGCGTVHDRGGAIVEQGERDLAKHDRLDLWMGYGMDGMRRALAWGVQHVDGEMNPPGSPIADSVNFSVPLPLTQILKLPVATTFAHDLELGDKGDAVKKLQTSLRKMNLYFGDITGNYDAATEKSVLDFQLKYFVLHSADEIGAGRMGPKTRAKMTSELARIETQKQIRELWESFQFEAGMSKGHRSPEVVKLQQILVQEEMLDVSPTGYFGPKTEAALTEFQIKYGIISSPYETGAGRVGEATQAKLNELLTVEREERKNERKEVAAIQKLQARLSSLAADQIRFKLAAEIARSDSSVTLLQEVLNQMGYYNGPVNGSLGPMTRSALRQFQLDTGLISHPWAVGNGVFGQGTRAKLAEVIRQG